MNKFRVKAFTIMEVSVAMLLTAITIAITYTVYNIVSQSYNSYTVKNNNMAVLIRLDELLKNDLEHADVIIRNEKGILIKGYDKPVSYDFEADFVVRISSITDTFKVKTQELSTSFENIPISEIGRDEEQDRIDEVQFSTLYEDKKIPYHYHKQYSAINLFQRNTNAVN